VTVLTKLLLAGACFEGASPGRSGERRPLGLIAPNTRFVFDSIPHSGTDHLRQRTNASLCFARLAE